MPPVQRGTKKSKNKIPEMFLKLQVRVQGSFHCIHSEGVCNLSPFWRGPEMFLLHPHTCALPLRARPHPLASRHTHKKSAWKSPSLVVRGTCTFPNAGSLGAPPTWEGYRFLAGERSSGIRCTGDVDFSPYWCFSIDTFFKPRTPTDSAKMSHRSRRETDRERALVSEGHWQGNLTIPASPPPMPRH